MSTILIKNITWDSVSDDAELPDAVTIDISELTGRGENETDITADELTERAADYLVDEYFHALDSFVAVMPEKNKVTWTSY